ncbi:2-dehydropantoate 2-reductase [Rhodoligotrophos appendicifer]|uniref:2-dehydropantoate 2-reductase n=1 Tax=Rhodoligotrophos appendicifer TaxID=987056 RepID=UPI001186E909|nr:2-dehydropantoate 2-reductase [Rhodoligotrophos appendicifer]
MRICIYGAGAIGGYLAFALAEAGADVSIVARGEHLAAVRRHGLCLRTAEWERRVEVEASDQPEDLGPQDYVIIALKAHSVPPLASRITTLFHDQTAVVTAVNGLPWWYFYRHGGPLENRTVESVDPGGLQWRLFGPERAIGCVVYPACEVEAPGVVRLIDGDRFVLGEPSGETSERVLKLAEMLKAGGLKAPIRPRIRDDIWIKLWGNLSFNPVSALTGGTLEQICRFPETRAVIRQMMIEAQAVGEALGVRFAIGVDKRIAGGEAVGAHKTSMLQDLERGRPLEIDALVSSVQEIARHLQLPTPTIDVVLGLVKLRAVTATSQ